MMFAGPSIHGMLLAVLVLCRREVLVIRAVSCHLQYKFWNIRSFQRVAAYAFQPWGMCHSLTWLCISRMLKLFRFWRVSSHWFIFLMDSW